jgi:hypothetical protein
MIYVAYNEQAIRVDLIESIAKCDWMYHEGMGTQPFRIEVRMVTGNSFYLAFEYKDEDFEFNMKSLNKAFNELVILMRKCHD